MEKEKLREIPLKNYIILVLVLLITMFILYYFYMWFDKYEETKLNRSILDNYMGVININELDSYLIENPDSIIYASVLNDENIREFEKKLKKKYKDNSIDKEILYLDLTGVNEEQKNDLKNKYAINNLDIMNVPCLLVFNDSEIESIYSVSLEDYDILSFVRYVNQIDYMEDDLK